MALTSEQELALLALLDNYTNNKKTISDLESAVEAEADQLLAIEKSSATKNISVDDIRAFVEENFSLFASEIQKGIMEIATNAEVSAGTDTQRAVVPSALASLFGTSLRSTNGYARLPVKVGGAFVEIILQWGVSGSLGGGGNSAITLPLAFPNAGLFGTHIGSNYTGVAESNNTVASLTTTTITIRTGSNTSQTYNWFAIGY